MEVIVDSIWKLPTMDVPCVPSKTVLLRIGTPIQGRLISGNSRKGYSVLCLRICIVQLQSVCQKILNLNPKP